MKNREQSCFCTKQNGQRPWQMLKQCCNWNQRNFMPCPKPSHLLSCQMCIAGGIMFWMGHKISLSCHCRASPSLGESSKGWIRQGVALFQTKGCPQSWANHSSIQSIFPIFQHILSSYSILVNHFQRIKIAA